ncbi:hypothetical protein [Streptomyces lavendulae]|uniref:hypothetical protein n=2 Tax=Streptomyces lavendulae TaxID=1914 RepID=UPI0024A15396|nr:hypothetical protein Slala05_49820 [Streptomyces lavendulae subsp. lavendulae]
MSQRPANGPEDKENHLMSRTLATADTRPRPFLEIRIGGLHLTVDRVPYRLLTLLTTFGGAFAGGVWYPR